MRSTEHEKTRISDTNKSIHIRTKKTDQRNNHFTIKIDTNGTEKEFIADAGSPEKEIKQNKKTLPMRKK